MIICIYIQFFDISNICIIKYCYIFNIIKYIGLNKENCMYKCVNYEYMFVKKYGWGKSILFEMLYLRQ